MKAIHEFDDHFVMEHPDGHEVKIAKKALSPAMLNRVQKLASGGNVQYGVSKENTLDQSKTDAFKSGFSGQSNPKLQQSQASNPQSQRPVRMAEGGDVESDMVSPEDVMNAPVDQSMAQAPGSEEPQRAPASFLDKLKGSFGDAARGAAAGAVSSPTTEMGGQGQVTPAALTEAPRMQNISLGGQQMPQQGQGAFPFPDPTAGFKQAAATETEAYKQGAEAQTQLLQAAHAEHQRIQGENQKIIQDYMNKQIDPNRMFHNANVGQKAATAIGLLLGGLSSGLTGQENPVMKFLNDQINRDVEAQRADLGKFPTLLENNLKQYGSMTDAMNATRLQHMALMEAQLGPGAMQMQMAPLMADLAFKRAMIKTAGQPGSGGLNPSMAVQYTVPEKERPEVFKELGALQAMKKGGENAISAFDKVANMVGSGVFSPRQKGALINPVVAQLSKETAGRFTETDSKFLESLFPEKFDTAETKATKRAQLLKLISEKMNSPTLDAYPWIKKPTISGARPISGGTGFQQAGYKGQ